MNRPPAVLRWGLAWALIRGRYATIIYRNDVNLGSVYEFTVLDPPKRWAEARDKRRAERAAKLKGESDE